jgi:hypothetical protein
MPTTKRTPEFFADAAHMIGTNAEIAKKHNVSPSYVSQVRKAVQDLRYPPRFEGEKVICLLCGSVSGLGPYHDHETGESLALVCQQCSRGLARGILVLPPLAKDPAQPNDSQTVMTLRFPRDFVERLEALATERKRAKTIVLMEVFEKGLAASAGPGPQVIDGKVREAIKTLTAFFSKCLEQAKWGEKFQGFADDEKAPDAIEFLEQFTKEVKA